MIGLGLADEPVERRERGRRHAPLGAPAAVGVDLLLFGVADAAVERQVVDRRPAHGGEQGLAGHVDRIALDEAQVGRAQALERGVDRALVAVEPADGVLDLVVFAEGSVEAQFLAEEPEGQRAVAEAVRERRGVVVVLEVRGVLAIGGDRHQLELVRQVPVGLARQAPAFELDAAVGLVADRPGGVGIVRVAREVAVAAADEARVVGDARSVRIDVAPGRGRVVVRRIGRQRKARARKHPVGIVRFEQHRTDLPAVVDRVVADDVDIHRVGRPPAQLAAQAHVVDLAFVGDDAVAVRRQPGGNPVDRVDRRARIDRGVARQRGRTADRIDAAEVHPLDVTVLLLGDAGHARVEALGNVEVEAAAEVDPVAAAVGGRDAARIVAFGALRIELHRPADRVAPGERPLRAAQDLDPLEIEQVEDRAGERGVVDVIHIEPDAGLERRVEVVLADAADVGDERGAEGRALRLERHRRGLVGHLADVGLAARLEHLGVDRGDRERGVLQVLLAELRGDEDLAAVRGCRRFGRRRVLRLGRHCRQHRQRGGAQQR